MTLTDAFILRHLLEDRACITEQISLFPDVHIQTQTSTFSGDNETCLSSAADSHLSVAGSCLRSSNRERSAPSLVHRYVHGTVRSSDGKTCNVDRLGTPAASTSSS